MTVRRGRPADWRAAIPSYQRPEVVARKTLPTLLGGGVCAARVAIFVRDDDPDLPAYRAVAASTGVSLIPSPARGIRATRRAILDTYAAGTPVLQVDDDVSGLVTPDPEAPTRTARISDVGAFVEEMFRETAARDLWVWGVAPVANAFFLRDRVSEGLKFLIYSFAGAFARPGHPVHDGTAEVKEDYELSLRAWWFDGAVLRADGVAARADHYTPGGCEETRSVDVEEEAVRVLERDWPGLVRRNTKRQGPYPEVLLARKGRGPRRPATAPLPGAAAGSPASARR